MRGSLLSSKVAIVLVCKLICKLKLWQLKKQLKKELEAQAEDSMKLLEFSSGKSLQGENI